MNVSSVVSIMQHTHGTRSNMATQRKNSAKGNEAELASGSSTESETRNSRICGSCNKNMKECGRSLQCTLCGFWHHAACEEVSDAMFQLLQAAAESDTLGSLHWYCKKCENKNKIAKGFMAGLAQLNGRQCNHTERTAIKGKPCHLHDL